jgi:septum formation inhibitor MinC
MAMTPKEAIAKIKRNQINQVTSIIKQNQAARNAFAIEPAKFNEAPTVQDVLSDLKAKIELKRLSLEEEEKNKYNMNDLEYQRYKSSVTSERRRALQGISSRAKKEKEAEIASKKELDELKKNKEKQDSINKSIEAGTTPLPNVQFGNTPALKSKVNNFADINIVTDEVASGMDITKTEHIFTPSDVFYLIEKGKFADAGFSDEDVQTRLGIDLQTEVADSLRIEDLQSLMYDYLQTPQGIGLKTAYKIDFEDEKTVTNEELLIELQNQRRNFRGQGFPDNMPKELERALPFKR